MATYNQISYGSKGSDVTELQKLLNQNGYTLDTDGIFGSKTQAAVKDYQQKNNLSVDGIVGKNTWGALTSAQTGTADTSTPEAVDNSFKYDDYAESDVVTQAKELYDQQIANKPGDYQSTWKDQLDDMIQKIMNREQFSYDLNGDALYQQYKDQYTTQGKLAMMDTMGQAAALTGGYGSSYGQAVGNQAYQGYLQQLNDRIPELYQLALSQYQMEGDNLYNQAALMAQMEDQEYGRYRDEVSDWYTELDRLYNQYNAEREYDYGTWADGRDFAYGEYSDNRAYEYQQEQDRIAQEQWQAEFDAQQKQWQAEQSYRYAQLAESQRQFNAAQEASKNTLSGSQILSLQKSLGVSQTGVWDSATQAAAKAKYGTTDANSIYSAWSAQTTNQAYNVTSFNDALTILRNYNAPYDVTSGLLNENDWAKSAKYNQANGGRFNSYTHYVRTYMQWYLSGESGEF